MRLSYIPTRYVVEIQKNPQNIFKLSKLNIEFKRKTLILISWIAVVAYFVWGLLLQEVSPNSFDPAWIRLALLAPIAFVLSLPLEKRPIRFGDGGLLFAGTFVAFSHSQFLIVLNNLNHFYLAGAVLTLTVCLHLATNLVFFGILSSMGLLSGLVVYITYNASPEALFYISSIITLIAAQILTLRAQLISKAKLIENQNELKNQFDNLMDSHRQLIIERSNNIHSARMAAIGEMASGVAHEVNNPLTIMKGYINRIKKQTVSSNFQPDLILEDLEAMTKTADRISHVVRSLSNISGNNDQPQKELVTLKSALEVSANFFQERFKEHQIHFDMQSPPPGQLVEGYASQISQCLVNLLSNSVDAVRLEENRWIKIWTERIENSVVIYISDSGKGIEEGRVAKIFDPFYTTKLAKKASGLGLAVTRSMIENHGGKLDYVDGVRNTTFRITLPLASRESIFSAAS